MAKRDPLGLAGNHIAQLIREGISPTAGLRAVRDAGLTIRTQTWYQAWNSVVHAIRESIDIPTYSLDRHPERGEYQPTRLDTKERYTYMVNVIMRNTDLGLSYLAPFAVTSNRQLTYGGALNTAIGYASEGEEKYNEEVMGGFVYGVYDNEI